MGYPGETTTASTRPMGDATRAGDLGKLMLRAAVATLLLFHRYCLMYEGFVTVMVALNENDVAAFQTCIVYVGEVLAPLMVLFGIWTRMAALIITVNMFLSILVTSSREFAGLPAFAGWRLELQAFFLILSIAIALFGAGKYSIGGTLGRWN
jgi:putative oxidoreductase